MPGGRRSGARRSTASRLVPPLVVLTLTLLVWRHTLVHLATWSQSDGEDEALFLSWLGHLPWAVTHGADPLVTHVVNAPDGVNALWNTSVLAPAALFAPVTLLGGVVLTYNLAMLAATATTALACVAACRRFVDWWPAALAGGCLAGFSPFLLGQGRGHLHLTAGAVPVLLLLVGHEALVRQRGRAWRLGVGLGLLVVLQFFTGTELLASTSVVAVLGAVVLAGVARRDVTRARARYAATVVGVAGAVAGVLLAYPLTVLLAGPQAVDGPAQSTDSLAADLLAPVVPTGSRLLAPASLVRAAERWPGNPVENTAYVGPLLVLLVAIVVVLRARPVVRWAGAMTLTCLVLSLGRELHVDGRGTGVPLPYAVLARTPLLESGAAVRYSFFTFVFAGLVVAAGVDTLHGRGAAGQPAGSPAAPGGRVGRVGGSRLDERIEGVGRVGRRGRIGPVGRVGRVGRRAAIGLLAAAVVAPLLPSSRVVPYRAVPVGAPAWFTGPGVLRVPAGSTLLTYPYPGRRDPRPLTWQALARFRYRQLGSYAVVPDPQTGAGRFEVPTATSYVSARFAAGVDVPAASDRGRAAVAELAARGVHTVVVVEGVPGWERAVAFWTAALGRPPARDGGVAVFSDVLPVP